MLLSTSRKSCIQQKLESANEYVNIKQNNKKFATIAELSWNLETFTEHKEMTRCKNMAT
jgi:hypothetical protein